MPTAEPAYQDGRGWLAFDVPAATVDDGTLLADGTTRPLASKTVAAFDETSAITVSRVSINERVHAGDDVIVSITARNDGDRDGLLLGGLQCPRSVIAGVPAGGSTTVENRVPTYEYESQVRVVVVLPGDDRSTPVETTRGTATETAR